MDDQHHHQAHFERSFAIYYTRLKNAYRDGVKDSYNKEYAADYFRTILLEENEAIPAKTVFFDELRTVFDHLHGLYGSAVASQITKHLKPIREKAHEALAQLERFRDGFGEPDFAQLPVHYDEQLEEGATPNEIIEQEKQVLALTDEQVVELLALYTATKKLLAELRPGTAPDENELLSETGKKDRFTRSQQVLVLYYLLKAGGVTDETAKVSDCARLLHKLIGVAEPADISNSDIYKMFKRPQGEFDRKTIRDLRAILPYFEKLPCYPVINSINEHLRDCNGD